MVDILWLLVCSGLAFLMQPGFMCLESGLTRSKNSINVAVKNFADFGISASLFWAFGYAVMFGATRSGWIGSSHFFIAIDGDAHLAAFFLFQTMFCGTATTIVSGAVAERVKFQAYLLIACLTSGVIYPLFGHWAWNLAAPGIRDGWLGKLGFVDFAGSTVVHSVGGWISLATLLIVGSRAGRFPRDGEPQKIHGSNLQLSVLGTMLLWMGWLGFNGGSTLALNDRVAPIVVHTILAAVAGMMAAMAIGWQKNKLPEVELLLNGSLAGLVSITASCSFVNTGEAIVIGAIGGAVMVMMKTLLEHLRIDDAVDAVPVHLGGGIWGTVALALFASPQALGTGLSGASQLAVQLLGVGVCGVWAFGLSYVALSLLDRFSPLRVSSEEEQIGLNISEHQAKTEIYDLFKVMDLQAQTQSLSVRVPVEPFTEVGQIAQRYNQVMDALEEAVARTQAIVTTATDAIVTFTQPHMKILTANPSVELVFGYSARDMQGMFVENLFELPDTQLKDDSTLLQILLAQKRHEMLGRRADGSIFPLEATVTQAKSGDRIFYTGTFRDISKRKQSEAALQRASREVKTLNQRLQAENKRMGAELDVTRRLQQMLLPKESELAEIAGLEIAGFMEPATEVGGDYYDVLSNNGMVKIGIGDVTGHGLESGVLTVMVQTAVRTLLENDETDPHKFLNAVNRTIYNNIKRMDSDKNVTLCLLDYKDSQLRISGQHEETIVVRANGKVERIDTLDLGFPVGIELDITNFINQTIVQLFPQDIVILYTDGITEAENVDRQLYSIERLCEVVRHHRHKSAQGIRESVVEDVRAYIGDREAYDDITLVVLKQK
ncbi:MAG: ammonium transporter [Geitlerinemataceae cyanobacterium]